MADHLDHVIAYGFPLVKQERNPHNYFADHRAEEHGTAATRLVLAAANVVATLKIWGLGRCAGLEFTDRFCEWLRAMTLTGSTYFECFQEVTAGSRRMLPHRRRRRAKGALKLVGEAPENGQVVARQQGTG